jgi:hypothetical protein
MRSQDHALFIARTAFLRWKSDYLFERSKESYLRWRLNEKFDPDQPRVPAGHGRESGRWTQVASQTSTASAGDAAELAGSVIWICEREVHVRYGDGSWRAEYRCSGGQVIHRSGTRGRALPFLRDPFRARG